MNQFCDHCLFSDALHSTIKICLKLKERIQIPSTLVNDLIDDDLTQLPLN